MKKTLAASLAIALIGLALPTFAHAATFTFVCEPSTEPAPPDWFGGPWSSPVRLVVDTNAKSIELFDKDNHVLGATTPPSRLSGLNNYQMDLTVTDSTISWGVIEMWGFSGYVARRSGRLDVIWSNAAGYSASTLSRQFHGTCKER
jgi:hypothetical protein